MQNKTVSFLQFIEIVNKGRLSKKNIIQEFISALIVWYICCVNLRSLNYIK